MDPGVPPATDLVQAMVDELEPLYGRIDRDGLPAAGPADLEAFLVGFDADGTPVCGGALKDLGDGVVEIKRMFVVPEARGRGWATALLAALEDAARERGFTVARLDTGPQQPQSERMYRRAGYVEIENFNANPIASFWGEKQLS